MKSGITLEVGKNLRDLLFQGGANEKVWFVLEEIKDFMGLNSVTGLKVEILQSERGNHIKILFEKVYKESKDE